MPAWNSATNNKEDTNKKQWRWKADMVIHSLWKKCLLLLNYDQFFSCKCRELQAVQHCQQETLRWFCETLNIALSAICSSNEMNNKLKWSFYHKTLLIFLKCIFKFLINTALPASNSIYPQNFMGKNVKQN